MRTREDCKIGKVDGRNPVCPGFRPVSYTHLTVNSLYFLTCLKSATKPFNVLLACTRPLITELSDKLRQKHPLPVSYTHLARTLDFATDTYGAASNVVLPFTTITEGDDACKWKATVRLLGVTGTEQLLTGEIRYADGNPTPTTLKSDITEALKGFNLSLIHIWLIHATQQIPVL